MKSSKQLEHQANVLLGLTKKRKTRRGKKKKPAWVSEVKRQRAEEMKLYRAQSKERWEKYQEFRRKVAVE